ncbi:hypothetical protein NliqN6_3341 [Naganishia liquefaciens]|uniref:Uncharacterized protein n=1 Tax=Naganishia liquefaciens TaxID=104408 RepID=A0A8H3TTU6_9TREE|nr:hypothetical protein NliqN6_3341 [Naganishia liquefaciens]
MPSKRSVRISFPKTGDDSDDDAGEIVAPGKQCLPMASLPGNFSGEPENGEEYLAMMHKQSKSLPWITTAPNPYKATHFAAEHEETTQSVQDTASTASSRKRHGALPSESWQLSFDEHFRNYRNYIQEQKPTMPRVSLEGIPHPSNQWYINGVKRKRIHKSKISEYPEIMAALQQQRGLVQDEQQVEDDLVEMPVANEEEMMNEEEEMLNEEEAMNDEDEWAEDDEAEFANAYEEEEIEDNDAQAEINEDDDATEIDDGRYFLEPEQPKHLPREPVLPLLAAFSQWRLHRTLSHINGWISDALDILSAEIVPLDSYAPTPRTTSPVPLSPLYARWIFSCLLFLDPHLSADETSDLRQLAKTCIKLVIWQVATGRIAANGTAVDEAQDEMRRSAWMIHRAIAGGWAQRDLVQDAEDMFAQIE